MTISRKIIESPIVQGADERIAYSLTTTPWASSPAGLSCKIYTYPGLVDVTSTNMTGSASAAGDVITTPLVISLTAGSQYMIQILFTSGGNTYEAWGIINAET